jgi:PTS system mannose-specific IIA component
LVGIIIVTHGTLAKAFVESASLIYGETINAHALGLFHGDNVDEFRGKISEALEKESDKEGVIIFTDILGGTPCNEAARLIYENKDTKKITCFAGVNMPMFLEALSSQDSLSYEDMVAELRGIGEDSIYDIREKFSFLV